MIKSAIHKCNMINEYCLIYCVIDAMPRDDPKKIKEKKKKFKNGQTASTS